MINDSAASDIVRAIKEMGRGFKLVKQISKQVKTDYRTTSLGFKLDETRLNTIEDVDRQLYRIISSLGYKWIDFYQGFFEKNTSKSKIKIYINIQEGRHNEAKGLEIKIDEYAKKVGDSKLYKIDNKIVKASSVSDAIKKMKDMSFKDYSELDQLLDNSSAARIFLNTLKHAGKISNMKQYRDYYEDPNIEFSYKFNITPQLEKQAYEKGRNTALGYMDWIAEMSGFRINKTGVYTQAKIKNVNYVEEANAEFLDCVVRVSQPSSASYIRKNGVVDPKATWNNFKIEIKLLENAY